MKKSLLLIAGFVLAAFSGFSQCTELFISEYVEGDFFNKAIELYNPTPNSVDLSQYRLIRWDNGSTDADQGGDGILPLEGTINPYDVFVVTLNTSTQGDEVEPDPALVAKADAQYGTTCVPASGVVRTLCFNGDDAMSLQKNVSGTFVNVDIFAVIGERPKNSSGTFSPTAAWTDIAPYFSKPSNYDGSVPYFKRYWTQDQTLVRKPAVTAGVSANPEPESWNVSVQWDSLGVNNFDSLGMHTCNCLVNSLNDVDARHNTRVFPIPSTDFLSVMSDAKLATARLYTITGQLAASEVTKNLSSSLKMQTSDLNTGTYLLQLTYADGQISNRKIIIIH